jgi:hypothetical protein
VGVLKVEKERYRHPRQRTLDGRSAEARRRKAVLSDLVQDLGGDGALTPGQQIVVAQLSVKLAALDALRLHIEKSASLIGEDGELLPSLRRTFLGYSNSVARDVALLHGLRERPTKKAPDLAGYLSSKKESKC